MLEAEPDVRPRTVRALFYEALAVSAFLHLILVVLIQPARWSGPHEMVIEARLAPASASTQTVAAQEPLPPEPPPTPASAQALPITLPQSAVSHTSATDPPRDNQVDLPSSVEQHAEPGRLDTAVRDEPPSVPLPEVPLIVDTRWYTAREVDRRPEPTGEIRPVYPEEARRHGITGSVVVALHIDEAGEVREVEILESNPPGVFDAAVIAAYGQARFTPAARGGRPVRYLGRYRVLFELE